MFGYNTGMGVIGRICIETGYVIIFLIVLMLLWLCGYLEEVKAEKLMKFQDVYNFQMIQCIHMIKYSHLLNQRGKSTQNHYYSFNFSVYLELQ